MTFLPVRFVGACAPPHPRSCRGRRGWATPAGSPVRDEEAGDAAREIYGGSRRSFEIVIEKASAESYGRSLSDSQGAAFCGACVDAYRSLPAKRLLQLTGCTYWCPLCSLIKAATGGGRTMGVELDLVGSSAKIDLAKPREETPQKGANRIAALDIARIFGLFAVYYGHIVEQTMYLGNPASALQYKFIYSFHMPLFFVLSGAIAKDWGRDMGPLSFAKSRLAARVVPLLAFNLALCLISLVVTPAFPPIPLHTAADYGHAIVMTLTRLPAFDIPTWFLMCLVSVEIVHALCFRFLRDSDLKIGAAIVAFYFVGYELNLLWNFFKDGDNYWFWNEAITMYAFYLVGVLIARRDILSFSAPRTALILGAIAALAFVYFTYDLNDGPFRMKISAVVILAAAHGQIVWFVATALAGAAAILLLAAAMPAWSWLCAMGQNALIFFCLNGVVYHHVNPRLAHWFIENWPQNGWSLGVYATGLSVLSLAAGAPVAIALNRYLPQLVGRPSVSGPWLPALLRADGSLRQVREAAKAANRCAVRP
jgi:acyltransferase